MSWFREMAGMQAETGELSILKALRPVSECRWRKGLRTKPWCNLTCRSWKAKSQEKRQKGHERQELATGRGHVRVMGDERTA